MKTANILMMGNKIRKIHELDTLASTRDIVFYNGNYYFTSADKLIILSENLATESLSISNPTEQPIANSGFRAIDKFGTDIVFVTNRGPQWTLGCNLYSYDPALSEWTQRFNWGSSTNLITDLFSSTKLSAAFGAGIRVFDSVYSQVSLGGGYHNNKRVCENSDITYMCPIPYARIAGTWTLLDEALTFRDVKTDGTDVLYFNSTSVYKVDGSTLVNLHDINVGTISYVYYASTRNKFYFVDGNKTLWEYSKTDGIKYIYRFPADKGSSNCWFTENSNNELILHSRGTVSELFIIK